VPRPKNHDVLENACVLALVPQASKKTLGQKATSGSLSDMHTYLRPDNQARKLTKKEANKCTTLARNMAACTASIVWFLMFHVRGVSACIFAALPVCMLVVLSACLSACLRLYVCWRMCAFVFV
jgi:hypothetical protein